MNYNIDLTTIEEAIREIKVKILVTSDEEQLKQLFYSLRNLVELKNVINYNSAVMPKVKDFFKTPSSFPGLEIMQFCSQFGLNPPVYGDKLVDKYSMQKLACSLTPISDSDKSEKVAYTKCSASDVMDLTKGFYKSIKNPIITDKALEILSSDNQIQFVKSLPRRMRFAGGIFYGDVYNNIPYMVLKQNNDIKDMIIFSHEMGHALECMLNRDKFLTKSSSAEMIPTTIELLAADYACEQGAMSPEERDLFKAERISVFNNHMAITKERLCEYQGLISPEQLRGEMIRSIALKKGYDLYKSISQSQNKGDSLYRVMTSPNSFEKSLTKNFRR